MAGVIHHVIARGIERRRIFKDNKERDEFLRRLIEGLEKTGCRCYAWCLDIIFCHSLLVYISLFTLLKNSSASLSISSDPVLD